MVLWCWGWNSRFTYMLKILPQSCIPSLSFELIHGGSGYAKKKCVSKMCVCVCVCTCSHVCPSPLALVCVNMWRPEADVRCVP